MTPPTTKPTAPPAREPRLRELTPKLTFVASADATTYADLVANPVFRRGAEAALAQFAIDSATAANYETAARMHWETCGAKRFLAALLNLAEPVIESAVAPPSNLAWGTAPVAPPPAPVLFRKRPPQL